MQNAAVLFTSWQKPPLLIDSSDETEKWLKELHSASTISVKLGERLIFTEVSTVLPKTDSNPFSMSMAPVEPTVKKQRCEDSL